ncbi:MAG TPA: NAD-dependent malic enzyme [Pyrinomonadaceae bacterium]|nr:NAD-dependent malic enzyme [Pyrinomonadaceae bacterium]
MTLLTDPIRSTAAELKSLNESPLEISEAGYALLDTPMFNKGSGFSEQERREFGLLGLLPYHHSTLTEQLSRAYENYRSKDSDVERFVFLSALQDRNETLFYRLVHEHISEMMPIIYTPTVGLACQKYSHLFRRPRGLYISYPYREEIATLLDNAPADSVDVIVVTDGERILGLGDLGVGGMGIPVGKLSLYTLCAGIHPRTTLPILLDVGTDNRELLSDPLYLGWRHERIRGEEYDSFIESFVAAVMQKFPQVLLQWEDFSKNNAARLLSRYRNRLCTFNDDIQGTGAVTLAGLLAAVKVTGSRLRDQRIAILGAGSSGVGISDQIVEAMKREGLSEKDARSRMWLVDSRGLVHSGRSDLDTFKTKYAQAVSQFAEWRLGSANTVSFADVIKNVQPTVLIGTSAQPGAFTEELVRGIAQTVEQPIVFPLSNPTSKCEATPTDLLAWTEGRALVATGSPFPPVTVGTRSIRIGQCNNSFVFPGVGLGVLASGANRVSNEMFVAAALALSDFSPALTDPAAPLYPPLEQVCNVSRKVAIAVALEAQRSGLAEVPTAEEIERRVDEKIWSPHYHELRRR